MATDLQKELASTAIPAEDIMAPLSYAETLRATNVSQESFKGTKKVATAGVVQSYNDLYLEVISKISKLASVFFPGNKPQQQLFSYSSILKALNNNSNKEENATTSKLA